MPNSSANETIALMRSVIAHGISVVPIKLDGSKRPAGKVLPKEWNETEKRMKAVWSPFQSRFATDDEIKQWNGYGSAAVCGAVSDNLELLDGDCAKAVRPFLAILKEHAPILYDKLVFIETPSGGLHSPFRCEKIEGSQPLARRLVIVPEGTKGARLYKGSAEQFKDKWVKTEIIFETRGEGGYFILPGSPLAVHSARKPYRFIKGSFDTIPTLTPDERDLLLALASSFDEMPKEPSKAKSNRKAVCILPGDDYNLRGDPAAVLTKHGWTLTHRAGVIEYYRRPGKDENGHSASLHAVGHNNLYCFSTAAAPFDAGRKYDAFGVYSRLEHNSDEKAAAKELAKDGYGSQQQTGDNSKKKGIGDDARTPAPTHDVLRDRWLKTKPATVFAMGRFMQYAKGVWKPVEEGVIKRQIQHIIEKAKSEGIRPTGGLLNSVFVLTVARCSIPSERFTAQNKYLVCANGTLNLETRQLEKHNPNHYCTSGVEYNYDPGAIAPAWTAFLDSLIERANSEAIINRKNDAGRELVDFLQEFAGLALTTDNSYETALWLHGDSGTGKSTFIEGLQAAMGDRHIEIGLSSLDQSRFSIGDLPGKTLAFATEQPGDFIRTTDVLIKMISGEMVKVEKKFAHPYSIRSTVKLIWAMNDLPRISSPNSGLFRRVKIVKWPKLDPADVKESVKEQIKKEGPGILNWALDGLARLRQNSGFVIPDEVRKATLDYKAANDIPAVYLAERCNLDPTGRRGFKTASRVLYEAYKQWCFDNGHKPKSSTAIAEDWKRLGLEHKMSGGYPYWHGVELRQNDGDGLTPASCDLLSQGEGDARFLQGFDSEL